MKRIALIGLFLAAALQAPAPASAADLKIAYGAYGSPTSTLVAHGIIPFIDEAQKLDGTLKFELLSGGAVVGAKTGLSGVRDGLVDAAQISSIYFPSELPTMNVTTSLSPGIAADTRAVAAATTEMTILHCDKCEKELSAWNMKYLGGYGVSSYSLLCTKPVKTLADLKGLRVRAAGPFGRMATALGMVPANMTISETYEGLQRGQIDCTFGSPGWLTSFSIGDVAKNVLLFGMGTAFGGPLIDVSVDKWKAADDKQKDALKHAAAVGVISSAIAYMAADDKVVASAAEKGYSFVKAGSDVHDVLNKFSKDTRDQVIDHAKERGIKDADQTVDTFLATLDKWKKIVADAGNDNQAIIDRLYTEVYAKMK